MDLKGAILEALPDLETHLNRTMHRSLKEKLPVSDVVQETYLKAHTALDRFEYRNHKSLNAWLQKIAKHIICTKMRKKATNDLGELADSIIESGVLRPSALLRQTEDVERVCAAVLKLPEHHRRLLAMRYTEGKTFEEIAQETNRSAAAVRGIHRNAINKLRRIYEVSQFPASGAS